MEHYPAKPSTMGQLYPESMSDTKSRFWQIGNQSLSRPEVICPQPRHATKVSYVTDSVNRFAPRPKGIPPSYNRDCSLEILDIILSKDDLEGDSEGGNQMSFFCCSPPVRTNNPLIHDSQFAKQTSTTASPLVSSHGMKPRVERSSPSCGSSFGGSPKARIEGFACGNSKSHCAVPALA